MQLIELLAGNISDTLWLYFLCLYVSRLILLIMLLLYRTFVLLYTQERRNCMSQTYLSGDTRTRIRDLIKDSNITQAELAEEIGISDSAFSRYLNQKTDMLGDGYIIRIAKFFNVSTDFLLGETNIPDKKNYDIEELGLSAESAKALYTGKVNTSVLNQLLQNQKFLQLTNLLARYKNETMAIGIASQNEALTFFSNLLLTHGKEHPEDVTAAKQSALDICSFRTPAVSADTNMLQNLFLQILQDFRNTADSKIAESRQVTKTILEQFRKELTKGEDSLDLKSLSPEDITKAILHMISGTNIPEETVSELESVLIQLFTNTKDASYAD